VGQGRNFYILERLNGEIRRRTRAAGGFTGGQTALMLAAAKRWLHGRIEIGDGVAVS